MWQVMIFIVNLPTLHGRDRVTFVEKVGRDCLELGQEYSIIQPAHGRTALRVRQLLYLGRPQDRTDSPFAPTIYYYLLQTLHPTPYTLHPTPYTLHLRNFYRA